MAKQTLRQLEAEIETLTAELVQAKQIANNNALLYRKEREERCLDKIAAVLEEFGCTMKAAEGGAFIVELKG